MNIMEFGVHGRLTICPMAVLPVVTENSALAHPGALAHPVVAAQAVYMGSLVLEDRVTSTEIEP